MKSYLGKAILQSNLNWSPGDDWNHCFSYPNRHCRQLRVLERPPHAVARRGTRALGAAIPTRHVLASISPDALVVSADHHLIVIDDRAGHHAGIR